MINKILLSLIATFLGLALLTGCFPSKPGASQASTTDGTVGEITPAAFSGAKSAQNKITGIQVSWDSSKIAPSSYRVYRMSGIKLILLTTLAPEITSFIDGTVTWGIIYTYVVRAVDKNGVEETNLKKVAALSWGGISSVEPLSRTSIQVNMTASTAVADEVRIYIQPAAGGEKTLVTTATGNDASIIIENLRVGFKYKVTAQAYVASLATEDGNSAEKTVTTNTFGYHDEDASTAKWLNIAHIRAFGSAPSISQHPTYPERTPRDPIVQIQFRAFNGEGSSTQYVVTRAADDRAIDTSSEVVCDSTRNDSCRVKCTASSSILTGTGVLLCTDSSVAPSPARYRYTMSILHTSGTETWAEPIPADNIDKFSILVPIPPSYMSLVQRDAVNYEMCAQMNAAVDAKNHNRCPYLGIGAVPYNSGPGKPILSFDNGFYDFGYNLFADRYPLTCKWTRAVDSGMCGAGQTSGDCIGVATTGVAPVNTIGKDGDVYQALWSGGEAACFYKHAGTWIRSTSVLTSVPNTSAAAALATMFTSDPTANDGKVGAAREYSTQYQAWTMCQGKIDPNYGAKRLPRMREYRAYNTFATMPTDLYGVTYAQALTIAGGGSFNSSTGYRCPSGITTATYTHPSALSGVLDPNNDLFALYTGGVYYGYGFQLTSGATADCQSRYGLQNIWNNTSWWTNDVFNLDSTVTLVTGTVSPFDSGNRDLLQDTSGGYNGFQVNYSTGTVNGVTSYYIPMSPGSAGAGNYISIPLGLPILTTSSSVYLPKNLLLESYSANFHAPYTTGPTYTARAVKASGRWQTEAFIGAVSSGSTTSTRCVMSAE